MIRGFKIAMNIKRESSGFFKYGEGLSKCQCCSASYKRLKLLEGPDIYICYECHMKLRKYQESPIQPIPLRNVRADRVTPDNIRNIIKCVDKANAMAAAAIKTASVALIVDAFNDLFGS